MLLFKFFHLKNKRKGIFEFLFGMLFTVLTATFSCLLMSPRMNRSVCKIISKHYIVEVVLMRLQTHLPIRLCWEAIVTSCRQTGGFQTRHCNIEKSTLYFIWKWGVSTSLKSKTNKKEGAVLKVYSEVSNKRAYLIKVQGCIFVNFEQMCRM